MREKLASFMRGRYGNDQFSRFLSIFSLVLLVLALILNGAGVPIAGSILWWLALALIASSYFRMLSRNIDKRRAELTRYLQMKARVMSFLAFERDRIAQRRTHHLFRCPYCRQRIRIPRGRGTLKITCPKCRKTFIRKS